MYRQMLCMGFQQVAVTQACAQLQGVTAAAAGLLPAQLSQCIAQRINAADVCCAGRGIVADRKRRVDPGRVRWCVLLSP